MTLRRRIIHGFLYIPFLFNRITAGGPFGPDGAVDLDVVPPAGSHRLKEALFNCHLKQGGATSCSVATVATLLNALGELQGVEDLPTTERALLGKVPFGHWKERMSSRGYKGKRGLPLPLLGEIVEKSLQAYGLTYRGVETVCGPTDCSDRLERTLRQRLVDFERHGKSLIVAHFAQGAFVRTLRIPHISPVGGFDADRDEVIVLDVDPELERPYKVPFHTFCRGLFSPYHPLLRLFGYRTGGYVHITLR